MAPTAPTTNGQFSFNVDSFYVESSGHHLHRRATTAELKAVFDTSAETKKPDHVGHWYEAQLLHYGLAPSKNKAVAKNRLLNALRGGCLAVPKEILKVETDLKRDWKKKDKESRSAALATQKPALAEKPKSAPKAAPKTTLQATAKGTTAKIAPATTTPPTTTTNAAAKRKREEDATGAASRTPAKKQATKQTAKRGGFCAAARAYEREVAAATKAPARKQTATRGRGGLRGGSSATGRSQPTVPEREPTRPPRAKQTARRSRAFYPYAGTGHPLPPQEPPSYDSIYGRDDSPQHDEMIVFDEMSDQKDSSYSHDSLDSEYDSNFDSEVDEPTLRPLGIINGEYRIRSSDLDQWDGVSQDQFSLLLALGSGSIWGAYDFGMFSGILCTHTSRPKKSSYEMVSFEWRGREHGEGEMSFGSHNEGWIQFLGDGRIRGVINCHGYARFFGKRVDSQDTTAPRSVDSMQDEWDEYNEIEYERERRARW